MVKNNILFILFMTQAICWGATAYDQTVIGYKKTRRYHPVVTDTTSIVIMPVKTSSVDAPLHLSNLVIHSDTGEIWMNHTLQKIITYIKDECITTNISMAPPELVDSIKTSIKKRNLFLEDYVHFTSPVISRPIEINNEVPDFIIFIRDFSIKTGKNPWSDGLEDIVKNRLLVLSAIVTIWDNRQLLDAWVGRIIADEAVKTDENGTLQPKDGEVDDLLRRFAELFFMNTIFEP